MLKAFEPTVHKQLSQLSCSADRVKNLVYWSYGADSLSYSRYSDIVEEVNKMRKALQVLEVLEKKFHNSEV